MKILYAYTIKRSAGQLVFNVYIAFRLLKQKEKPQPHKFYKFLKYDDSICYKHFSRTNNFKMIHNYKFIKLFYMYLATKFCG